MREYTSPLTAPVPRSGNLADDLLRNAGQAPDRAALSRPDPGSVTGWTDVSAAELLEQVRSAARGLVAAGIAPGDRVAIVSRTRWEWTVLDYAVWYAGAVGVPAYTTSPGDQLGWVLQDSGATAAVVETPELAARLREAAGSGSPLREVWVLDPAEGPGALEELARRGAEVPADELERRRAAVDDDDVATIIYTSGTTGSPKGCVLTHRSFHVELGVTLAELDELFDEEAATLLVLPMAHVLARLVQVGAVKARVRLGHTPDIRRLPHDLRSFRPTFLLGVPRIFEKVFTAASQQAASEGRGRLFDRATEAAIRHSTARERGRVGPLVRSQHALYDRLVYPAVREALGGRCRYAVSGGAPLGERLAHFFRGIGMPILEGYGLTETTGAVTLNVPDNLRVGTVGRPLPGTAVRVAEDGELLVRGEQLLTGYWRDPEGSAAVLPADGWLRTGDLGEIDGEGFVRVTGRKNEVLVTAGGKHVAPGLLEDRLRSHPLVEQALVVGDGRPYVAALVTLDHEAAAEWARARDDRRPPEQLTHDPALRAEVQQAVDAANATVSQAEAIRRFEVLPAVWSEESGELTPSLKLRRNVVLRRYRGAVEELYD